MIVKSLNISLLPADFKISNESLDYLMLYAANDDKKNVALKFSLRRTIKWNFCVVAVPHPIIRANLLAHYYLVLLRCFFRIHNRTTKISLFYFYSKLDLHMTFHQLPIASDHVTKKILVSHSSATFAA